MGHTFDARPATGVIIYEDSDDLPPTDPFTYRSRVKFWSGFRYPARVLSASGTLTFGTGSHGSVPDTVVNVSHTLFAHGLGSAPLMMEGKWIGIGTSGADVPMIGSVPVQNFLSAKSRWATLGADATNVYIHEQHNSNVLGSSGLTSFSIDWEVHIIDFVTPPAGEVMLFEPDRFRAGDFDSEERYIRAVSSGGYALASGTTCLTQMSAPTGAGSERVVWHHAITGYYDKSATLTTTGTNVDPGTPTPTVQTVTV